jgi:hypothetical protein
MKGHVMLMPILLACLLASAGALAGEWWRLRRRWSPQIAPSYGTAALCAVFIVLAQVAFNAIVSDDGQVTSALPLGRSVLIALVVGPALHAVTWNLLVLAWDTVRTAAVSGRRSPRG